MNFYLKNSEFFKLIEIIFSFIFFWNLKIICIKFEYLLCYYYYKIINRGLWWDPFSLYLFHSRFLANLKSSSYSYSLIILDLIHTWIWIILNFQPVFYVISTIIIYLFLLYSTLCCCALQKEKKSAPPLNNWKINYLSFVE